MLLFDTTSLKYHTDRLFIFEIIRRIHLGGSQINYEPTGNYQWLAAPV